MIDLVDVPKTRTRFRASRVRTLAELFFRRLTQSTSARRREARRTRPVYFESFEPRLLLSSDPLQLALSPSVAVALHDEMPVVDNAPPTPPAAAPTAAVAEDHDDHPDADHALDAAQTFYVSLDGESNVIEVYVGHLRQKVEAGGEPRLIHTVRHAGYVLRA